eukprot:403339371
MFSDYRFPSGNINNQQQPDLDTNLQSDEKYQQYQYQENQIIPNKEQYSDFQNPENAYQYQNVQLKDSQNLGNQFEVLDSGIGLEDSGTLLASTEQTQNLENTLDQNFSQKYDFERSVDDNLAHNRLVQIPSLHKSGDQLLQTFEDVDSQNLKPEANAAHQYFQQQNVDYSQNLIPEPTINYNNQESEKELNFFQKLDQPQLNKYISQPIFQLGSSKSQSLLLPSQVIQDQVQFKSAQIIQESQKYQVQEQNKAILEHTEDQSLHILSVEYSNRLKQQTDSLIEQAQIDFNGKLQRIIYDQETQLDLKEQLFQKMQENLNTELNQEIMTAKQLQKNIDKILEDLEYDTKPLQMFKQEIDLEREIKTSKERGQMVQKLTDFVRERMVVLRLMNDELNQAFSRKIEAQHVGEIQQLVQQVSNDERLLRFFLQKQTSAKNLSPSVIDQKKAINQIISTYLQDLIQKNNDVLSQNHIEIDQKLQRRREKYLDYENRIIQLRNQLDILNDKNKLRHSDLNELEMKEEQEISYIDGKMENEASNNQALYGKDEIDLNFIEQQKEAQAEEFVRKLNFDRVAEKE